MCSTSHFHHISKGTALGIVFIQSTENSVVLLRFLEYLLFFCQKLRQYLIYSKLKPYFLVLATKSHALPFYICHFTMSKWMAKAEEKKEKRKTLWRRSFAVLFCILWIGLFLQFFKDISNKQGSDNLYSRSFFFLGRIQLMTSVSTSMHDSWVFVALHGPVFEYAKNVSQLNQWNIFFFLMNRNH